jgi:Caspase domain
MGRLLSVQEVLIESPRPRDSFEVNSNMPRSINALLVGIDRYQHPVSPLNGCVNDIEAFDDYLRQRVEGADSARLELRVLTDQQATRAAIIAGFREHLKPARKGDVALFYYAEPDRLDETLVCHDSRSPGGHDLADKELAQLVHEVAAGRAHAVVILDCCHSGSGTRNADLQSTAPRQGAPGWERGLQPRWQDPRRRILCLRPRWWHRRCGSVGRRSLLLSSTRWSDRQP